MEEQKKTRFEFLERKGVMADKHPKFKQLAFDFLNDPSQASNEKEKKHYEECQGRLDRLLKNNGDSSSNDIPGDVQTFETFCQLVPEWNDPNKSYVFFRDEPKVEGKEVLVQRAQLSGLCYIHGPDMLQHYLVSMNTEKSAGMIDISKLIRENFDALQLEDHIFKDDGGSSETMLRFILETNSIVSTTKIDCISQDLKKFGPLLVSRFKVHAEFSQDIPKYHGKPTEEYKGLHAMILIGARIDNDKEFFLLQNWWKSKQFIEVDKEYLKLSSAALYYVETPQLSIPNQFPVYYAKFSENENLDKAETYPHLEGPLNGMFC